MDQARRNVKRLTFAQRDFAAIAVVLDRQCQLAVDNVQRFLFHFVVLEAERLALVDVQDLSDVTLGLRKDQLVAPRFRDVRDRAVLEKALVFTGIDDGFIEKISSPRPSKTIA